MEQNTSPTLLEQYWSVRHELELAFQQTMPNAGQLWVYQELLYRTQALEVLKLFFTAAPFTTDTRVLVTHYQMVSGYIQHLLIERQFGTPVDDEAQKQRQTAYENLRRIVIDHDSRFGHYAPRSQDQYQRDIGGFINNVLTAWIVYRNTLINIKTK